MNNEIVWVICPISSILWILGGTYKKQFRRLGFPVLMTTAAFLFLGWSWWWIGLFAAAFGVTLLPFTLKGDGVPGHWFNWVWIWIAGACLGLPSLIIGLQTYQFPLSLLLLIVPCLAQGLVGTFSNLAFSRKFFPWKFCESVIGFSAAIPPALLIDSLK